MTSSRLSDAGRKVSESIIKLPLNSWDSHMHIVEPEKHPLAPNALYKPTTYTIDDALAFESSIGIGKIVLVQPSIYGLDNICLLNALRRLGPERARGVVTFNPDNISQAQLKEWHSLGVRGARLNLQSYGKKANKSDLLRDMHKYAEALRPLDWVLQLYMTMSDIPLIQDIVPSLGIRVCIDHLGSPNINPDTILWKDPYDIPGFQSLANLLESGQTYIKLSAAYRISKHPDYHDLEPLAKEIIKLCGGSKVVFATDWPHTRFEGLDIKPWIQTVFSWCEHDEWLIDRIFRGNAQDLWMVGS